MKYADLGELDSFCILLRKTPESLHVVLHKLLRNSAEPLRKKNEYARWLQEAVLASHQTQYSYRTCGACYLISLIDFNSFETGSPILVRSYEAVPDSWLMSLGTARVRLKP